MRARDDRAEAPRVPADAGRDRRRDEAAAEPRSLMTPRRRLLVQLRYLRALVRRFRITLVLAVLLFGGAPLAFRALYVSPEGARIGLGEAVHHVYFLMFGQPSLAYVDIWAIELMNLAIPPLGIAVVVDGIVRFAYLFFAKRRSD